VLWLSGARFRDIALRSGRAVDDLLGIHSQLVTFALQTTVEQAIAVLAKLVEAQGKVMAPAVAQFPDHLRFGVPTPLARSLVAAGVRHRRAAIELGSSEELRGASPDARTELLSRAHDVLTRSPDYWRTRLGELVFESTLADVASAGG
jgi:helicase